MQLKPYSCLVVTNIRADRTSLLSGAMESVKDILRRKDDEVQYLFDKGTRLESEVFKLREKLKQTEDKLTHATNKLTEAEIEVTRARRYARDRSNSTKRLQDKLEKASDERDRYEREVKRLEASVKVLRSKLTKSSSSSSAELKVLQAALRDEVAKANELSKDNAGLRRTMNSMKKKVRADAEARIESVASQLERERETTRALRDELKVARIESVASALERERETTALRDELKVEKIKKRAFSMRAAARKQQISRIRKREDALKTRMKEEAVFFKVRRTSKPFHALSNKQQRRIQKAMKEKVGLAVEKIHSAFEVKGYGPMRIVVDTVKCLAAASGMITSVSMQKTSCYRDQVRKIVKLRDSKNVSKKKIHEFHMLYPDVIPSVGEVNKEEQILNDEIEDLLSPNVTDTEFHVPVVPWLRFLIAHRGLERDIDDTIHLLVEADGRGTGKSFHSVIMQMRILNEGPTIFRNDRAYLLSVVAGKESHAEIKSKLGDQFDALEGLQLDGLIRADGVSVSVKLHFISDAKFAQLCHGMMRFCDDGPNCLYCRQHSKHRTDLSRRCYIHANRFLRPGKHGQKLDDLLSFIPMERRWSEGMHLVMRLLHDKLIKKAFQDVINSQDEGTALSNIHSQMRDDPISIQSFEIFVFDDKEDESSRGSDSSRAGKWCWRTPSFTQVKCIARNFDFVKAYPDHLEETAWQVQDIIRKWINSWTQLYETWPGDGDPELSADDIYDRHVELIRMATDAAGQEEVEPGEDEFVESLFPLHIITPYCHTFVNHLGEMWENSKELSKFFNDEGGITPASHMYLTIVYTGRTSGGLAHARTDSLERQNLDFFHAYFQTCSRRPKEIIKHAGLASLRRALNPTNIDRSKYICDNCGRGMCYKKSFEKHTAKCKSKRFAVVSATTTDMTMAVDN